MADAMKLVPVEPTEEDKNRARRAVREAIKRGELVRPETCQTCKKTFPMRSDGRPQIQGHHPDYNRPLFVEWLCASCHRKETPLPEVMGAPTPGERNGAAKLTESAVRAIRASSLSNRALGREYGFDHRAIGRVKTGQQWSQVQ